jgi:hypothetical protein
MTVKDSDLSPNRKSSGVVRQRFADITVNDFELVSSRSFLLHVNHSGLHAFCPVLFDETHLCQADLIVHCSVLDYRLRVCSNGYASDQVHTLPLACDCAAKADQRNVSTYEKLFSEHIFRLSESHRSIANFLTALGNTIPEIKGAEAGRSRAASSPDSAIGNERAASDSSQADLADRPCGPEDGAQADLVSLLQLSPLDLPDLAHDDGGELGSGTATGVESIAVVPRNVMEKLAAVAAQVAQSWRQLLRVVSMVPRETTAMLRGFWLEDAKNHWSQSVFEKVPVFSEDPKDADTAHDFSYAQFVPASVWRREDAESAIAIIRGKERYPRPSSNALQDLSIFHEEMAHPLLLKEQFHLPPSPITTASRDAMEATASAGTATANLKTAPATAANDATDCAAEKTLPRPVSKADSELSSSASDSVHVRVLVHGFQGSQFDMRLLKGHLAVIYPDGLCLCSSVNEEGTDGDIAFLGANLADEVKGFLHNHCPGPPGRSLGRLSFLGYSMGGVIVRSALPYLEKFREKFHSYVTFSSPHLGYVYSTHSAPIVYLWVAKKLRDSKSLEQLSMTDAKDAKRCFLYQLSKKPGLEHFRHVLLLSSRQDQYVPFESARIEPSSASGNGDSKRSQAYAEMVENILGPLEASKISRINVDFHLPETNFDTVIGRAAHIEFIQCHEFIRMLMHTHSWLFE